MRLACGAAARDSTGSPVALLRGIRGVEKKYVYTGPRKLRGKYVPRYNTELQRYASPAAAAAAGEEGRGRGENGGGMRPGT